MSHKIKFQLSALSLSIFMALTAQANPTGPQIMSGDITINPTDASGSLVIDQNSHQGAINWQEFNINSNESVRINMPDSSSVQLDRVIGQNPSQIMGSLSSNGQVFLINPNGVIFGKNAKIDVGALVASTLNIKDQDFLAAHYDFNHTLNSPAGAIQNFGEIHASDGVISLLAPQVENHGIIKAELGDVLIGAGSHAVLTLGNNPLLGYTVDESLLALNENGKPVVIKNTGKIQAQRVYLNAAGAHQVLNQVVSNSGLIEASGVKEQKGEIVLFAQNATTDLSGTLKASGGKIKVLGKDIHLADTAKIEVSGSKAGEIYVGGPAEGNGDMPKADTVRIEHNAELKADSHGDNQNGGHIVVWSEQLTQAPAHFSAQSEKAEGGLVETSSHHKLEIAGAKVSTKGFLAAGTWLLDPYDFTIDSSTASTIVSELADNNVVVTTGSSGSEDGDIFINSAITYTSDNNLSFQAAGNIEVNADMSATGTGKLVLRADSGATGTGTVSFGVGITIAKDNGSAQIYYNPTGGYNGAEKSTVSADFFSDEVTLSNGATLDSFMLVNSTTNLATVASLVNAGSVANGKFAIGKALDMTGVSFSSIGTDLANPYLGYFNGQGYDISNLSIANTTDGAFIGLFGYLSSEAVISNISLTGLALTDASANSQVGGIAGYNAGAIFNSSTAGTITNTANATPNTWIGGLVGQNAATGSITDSFSSVAVTSTANAYLGGLVGNNLGSVTTSYATGNIQGADSNFGGGLVGNNETNASIVNSYATGSVNNTTNGQVGGLAGFNKGNGVITNSYAIGRVSTDDDSGNRGGLLGYNQDGNNTVTASIWNSTVNSDLTGVGGGATTGILPRSTAAMQTPTTYTDLGWNTAIWTLAEGSYPSLASAIVNPTGNDSSTETITAPVPTPTPTPSTSTTAVSNSAMVSSVTNTLAALFPALDNWLKSHTKDKHQGPLSIGENLKPASSTSATLSLMTKSAIKTAAAKPKIIKLVPDTHLKTKLPAPGLSH